MLSPIKIIKKLIFLSFFSISFLLSSLLWASSHVDKIPPEKIEVTVEGLERLSFSFENYNEQMQSTPNWLFFKLRGRAEGPATKDHHSCTEGLIEKLKKITKKLALAECFSLYPVCAGQAAYSSKILSSGKYMCDVTASIYGTLNSK